MIRLLSCVVGTLLLSGTAFAQCCGSAPTSPVSGGPFAALNAPLVPGLTATPGMPTPSVLGLLAPRLSLASSFFQSGGFGGPNAGQYLLGVAAPRLAPVFALQAGTIQPQQAVLGVLSPRLAVGAQVLQAGGGGRLFGGRCGCR